MVRTSIPNRFLWLTDDSRVIWVPASNQISTGSWQALANKQSASAAIGLLCAAFRFLPFELYCNHFQVRLDAGCRLDLLKKNGYGIGWVVRWCSFISIYIHIYIYIHSLYIYVYIVYIYIYIVQPDQPKQGKHHRQPWRLAWVAWRASKSSSWRRRGAGQRLMGGWGWWRWWLTQDV